jgi:murein DD-endopeptidase MepM/ murein hydrolase activator NlpD
MARCDKNISPPTLWCGQLITALKLTGLLCIISAPPQTTHATPAQLSAKPIAYRTSSFVYPVMGPRESSRYGVRSHPIKRALRHHHDGIDLAAPKGAVIRSIAGGQVMYSDPFGGYGNLIVIKHESGLTSHYGHCETLKVKVGQFVRPGDIIGTVGSTGRSTGPHLHFEIRRNGKPQHPERILPGLADPTLG